MSEMKHTPAYEHKYRINGDSMQEVYPPDYAEWLETQEPTIKEMDEAAEKQEQTIVF